MVDTEAIAVPLLIVADLPARLNTNGIMHDTPNPVNTKPIAAGMRNGNKLAVNKPVKIKIPLYFNMAVTPNLGTILSPKKRPVVMQTMYNTKAAVAVSLDASTAFRK